jgi:hypothetical protein
MHGTAQIELPADLARLVVVVPSNGSLSKNTDGHTTINDIVIDYH